jgi:hypothetical protein
MDTNLIDCLIDHPFRRGLHNDLELQHHNILSSLEVGWILRCQIGYFQGHLYMTPNRLTTTFKQCILWTQRSRTRQGDLQVGKEGSKMI